MNTEEGEGESEAFRPPPKMSELNLPQQPVPMGSAPVMSQPPMPGMPPAAQSPSFMTAAAPVPTPMVNQPMNQNQPQLPQAAEDAQNGDNGNRTSAPNNLQSNQFKLQRNRSKLWKC